MADPIPIRCHCGRFFEIPVEFAGRRVECPGCAMMVEVPKVQTDVPALKGSALGEEFESPPGPNDEFQNVLDRPMHEVIADQKRSGGISDSGLEVAPEKNERYCPGCRNVISRSAQRCGECESVFCPSCLQITGFGHSRCRHCRHRLYRREPAEGWPRKIRPHLCPHCSTLPVDQTELCFSCGKPFDEGKSSWPAAPSVGRTGTLHIGSNRTIGQEGRRAISMGVIAGIGGGIASIVGSEFIEPSTSLGGSAWKIVSILFALIFAGKGFRIAWQSYGSEGQERWSAIAGMVVCGLVFLPLLLPGLVLDAIETSRKVESLNRCTENLESIADSLRDYRRSHEGRLPPLDRALFFGALSGLDSTDRIRCPARPDDSLGYAVYESARPLPAALLRDRSRTFPLVWDRDDNHEGVRQVLFLDGHVERLDNDEFTEIRRDADVTIEEFTARERDR